VKKGQQQDEHSRSNYFSGTVC